MLFQFRLLILAVVPDLGQVPPVQRFPLGGDDGACGVCQTGGGALRVAKPDGKFYRRFSLVITHNPDIFPVAICPVALQRRPDAPGGFRCWRADFHRHPEAQHPVIAGRYDGIVRARAKVHRTYYVLVGKGKEELAGGGIPNSTGQPQH